MGLREEKKQATRAAIVNTALGLFRGQGFERTRVQDVATRLRISEATFFNYFPTKQSVLEAIALDLIDEGAAHLEHDIADSDRPVAERIGEVTARFADGFDRDPELARMLALHTGLFVGAHRNRLQRTHTLLSTLFAQGQSRGEIADDIDADALAELFLSTSLSTMVLAALSESGVRSVGDRLRVAVSVLLRGCLTAAGYAEDQQRPDQASKAASKGRTNRRSAKAAGSAQPGRGTP
jgi:NADH dehydrogenase